MCQIWQREPMLRKLGDQTITPYPRYMSGFKPGRQGGLLHSLPIWISWEWSPLRIIQISVVWIVEVSIRLHVWHWQFLPDAL
ncbi:MULTISPECIES: hypothetical protein [Photorhabdus]|uniref:hypothetical protein n=1 Tax=Photorhabdus TaxID=29487 RepID=UPI0013010C7D|nr:hypothetical protein [Photorhabdus thracensis]